MDNKKKIRNRGSYQRPNNVEDIIENRLKWVRYVWRKEGSMLRTIMENALIGKRQLGRLRL